MRGRINHSSHEFISLIEIEVRLHTIMIIEDMRAGLGQTMCTEDVQDMIKILGVGQDMILVEEGVIGIKIMVEIAVGHMKGR